MGNASSFAEAVKNSSIGNISPRSVQPKTRETRNPENYSIQDIRDSFNSYSSPEERDAEKWKAAVFMADEDGSARTGAELRALQDTYFNMLEPESGVTSRDFRGQNLITDAMDWAGDGLDQLYLKGGDALDFGWDTLVGGTLDTIGEKDLAQEARDLFTGTDAAIVPEIASDLALMAIPGVGWGALAAKGAIDSRDQLIQAATGRDRYTGNELSETERALNLGAGTLGTVLPAIAGGGATKAAAKTLGKAAGEEAQIAEEAAKKAYKAATDATKKATKTSTDAYSSAINNIAAAGVPDDLAKQIVKAQVKKGSGQALTDAEKGLLKSADNLGVSKELPSLAKAAGKAGEKTKAAKATQKAAKADLDKATTEFEDALNLINNANDTRLIPRGTMLPDRNMIDTFIDLNARKAAANAASGPLGKARAFLKNPIDDMAAASKEVTTETAEKAAKKSSRERLDEALAGTSKAPEKESIKGLFNKLTKEEKDAMEAGLSGIGPVRGMLTNAGVGAVNLGASSSGDNLQEIYQGALDNIRTAYQDDAKEGLLRGAIALGSLMPTKRAKHITNRYAGNRTPYWAKRGVIMGDATDNILGNRATPITPENEEVLRLLAAMYKNENEEKE